MSRAELLRAIQTAHTGHRGVFQGGNFYQCDGCSLHIMFREGALAYKPRRARKEHTIITLEDVQRTVRS